MIACYSSGGVSISGRACVHGRCVADACACSVSPTICCYPSEGATPTSYDGEWSGKTDQDGAVAFTVDQGAVRSLSFDWTVPQCRRTDGQNASASGTVSLAIPATDGAITPYGTTEWISSSVGQAAPFENPSFSTQITFPTTATATGIVVPLVLFAMPPYDCSGQVSLSFSAARQS